MCCKDYGQIYLQLLIQQNPQEEKSIIRQEESVHNVQFVPFSLEAGGVWGPAAKKFFKQCASQADNQDRDVDLYHWSSAKFESTWRDTISVLVARGRAQVGVHSAKSDWSRRILDFAYMDYDEQAAHHE